MRWPMPQTLAGVLATTSSVVFTPAASGTFVWRSTRSCKCGMSASLLELGGGVLDRLHNLVVAGTAADISGDALADLGFAGLLVLLQQALGRHDHAGGAEATLQAMLLPEALLYRVQLAALRH